MLEQLRALAHEAAPSGGRGEVPADLLRAMITFRVREHEEHGVVWM